MTTETLPDQAESIPASKGPRHLFSCTQLRQIERVHKPSVEQFLEDYVRKFKPVIMTGVAEDWPCMKWTPEYMRSRIGKVKVQRSEADGMHVFTKFMHIPYKEFEKSLSTTKDLYLSVDPILERRGVPPRDGQLAGLAPDIVYPPYCTRESIQDVNLWMGPGGNKTLLHYDAFHGLLVVLEGRKRFAAYHSSHVRNFFPYSVFNFMASWAGNVVDSQINAQDVGDEHIDRVRNADGVYGELERGEMLFLPAGTWHYVESDGRNLAINYFYDSKEGLDRTKSPLREYWIKVNIIKSPIKIWRRFKSSVKWTLIKLGVPLDR